MALELFGRVQERDQPRRSDVGRVAGHVARQDIYLGAFPQRLAQCCALGGKRHEEPPCARCRKRRADPCSAKTIGIGLDHGTGFGGTAQAGKGAPVGGDGVKVYGQDRAGHARPFDIRGRKVKPGDQNPS